MIWLIKEIQYLEFSGLVFSLLGYLLTVPTKYNAEKVNRFSELVSMMDITLFVPNISWIMHFSGLVTDM
jgi:hypothetical protein